MSVVTLALAKEFLEITHSAQDNVIQLLIDGAEEFLAKRCRVHFASAEYVEDLDGGYEYLFLGHRPATEVESVVDLWTENEEYSSLLVGDGRLMRADSAGKPLGDWPKGIRRFRATYTAGFATMPAPVKQAVVMLVRRAYEARGGESSLAAAGASMNFEAFMQSDIPIMLREFSRARHIAP